MSTLQVRSKQKPIKKITKTPQVCLKQILPKDGKIIII